MSAAPTIPLSIVIPVYNEELNLPTLFARLYRDIRFLEINLRFLYFGFLCCSIGLRLFEITKL